MCAGSVFADESLDFVLCWDGNIEAADELIRVTKKGEKISMYLVNQDGSAIRRFHQDPDSALASLKSNSSHVYGEKYKAVGADEAIEKFESLGVKVIDTYAVCGMLDMLRVPRRIQESRVWEKRYFDQVTEILLRLSNEPSVKGLSRHLVMYGERC